MEDGPRPHVPSDAELLDAARSGDASAFAVLLRRHEALLVDLATGPDGERALLRLGVRAMRELRRLGPDRAVRTWLAELVADERRRTGASATAEPARPSPEDGRRDWLDRCWSELSSRWPDGRRRRRVPGWARVGIAAVVIVLGGIAGTTALLRERPAPPLVAQVQAYAEPVRGDDFAPEDDPDADELPVFVFPDEGPDPDAPAPDAPDPDAPAPDTPDPDAPGGDAGGGADGDAADGDGG